MALLPRRKAAPVMPQAPAAALQTAAERVVELEDALGDACADLAEARARIEEAQRGYTAALDVADVSAATTARAAVADAEMLDEIAHRQVGRLTAELAAARADQRREETAAIVAEATAKAVAFRNTVETGLPQITAAARTMLRAWAEAELARVRANVALAADDEPPLPGVESFRSWLGRPARQLSEQVVDMWVDGRGDAVPEAQQAAIRVSSDGSGHRDHGTTGGTRYTAKRRFSRIETLAAEPARVPDALAAVLALPGLTARDQPGWTPLRDPTPAGVLQALSRLERAVEPDVDTRQPTVRFVPIPDEAAREVVRRQVPTAAVARGIV